MNQYLTGKEILPSLIHQLGRHLKKEKKKKKEKRIENQEEKQVETKRYLKLNKQQM